MLGSCLARAQRSASIHLFFYGANPNLTHKQVARLDSLLNTIDRSRIVGVALVGHTDSLFGRASNLALAEKRALSVKELLVDRNVPDPLITITAFNAPIPVAEDPIPTGRGRNRRVFMRIEYGPVTDPGTVPVE
ncbi:MAG TPA: OmpA family protein, partial [Flavobacteriales bacterium]|nr:OmpA family protein [Flavobacteriales bacterium]